MKHVLCTTTNYPDSTSANGPDIPVRDVSAAILKPFLTQSTQPPIQIASLFAASLETIEQQGGDFSGLKAVKESIDGLNDEFGGSGGNDDDNSDDDNNE